MSARGKKKNKAFWNNIKFKYKLTITNENTLEEVVGLYVSKLNGFSVLFSVLVVLFLIAALIIAFTPLRNYLPGYMNSEVRAQMVQNALLADSLEKVVYRQDLYIMNIQDIISGKVKADTVRSMDSLTHFREDTLIGRSQRERDFISQYEETEKYNLSTVSRNSNPSGLIFYAPVRGVVGARYDRNAGNLGVQLLVEPNEGVLAVLDGTVILSTYTSDYGYLIQVQHSQDFISVYKYCGSLLKQAGDRVMAGEVIALSGKSSDSDRPELIFELWHKGVAVNPEKYILF